MSKLFKSTHNLHFMCAPHDFQIIDPGDVPWVKFKIGTCEGLWRAKNKNYEILAIKNHEPGNGHFQDMFDWFENSCKRDKHSLVVIQVDNKRLKKHLLEKRGFIEHEKEYNSVIKIV